MRFSGLAAVLAAGTVCADPAFDPVAMPDHVYGGGWEHFVGGGVAVFDCNGDHLPEIFAAGGENPSQLFRNISTGKLAFSAKTPVTLDMTGVVGAYPLDVDSDGITDLVILRAGQNVLMRGGPDCSFTPFDRLGFDSGDRWTTAFSATWERGNTLPTLAFGNYVDRDDPDGPFEACDANTLYRPDGDTYVAPILLTPGYCALSILFSDWGRQGRADLRISNDRHYYVRDGEEQLWAMEDTPRLYTEEDGWIRHQLWGMGIASRDLTGDGVPEVMLSSMGDQRMQEQVEAGVPGFRDVPFARGTTAQRPYVGNDGRPSTGWHIAFGDVQNDGRDDIFIAKGNVDQMPGLAMEDPNNLLIQLDDSSFVEKGDVAGLDSLHRARGAALADLNRDGLLDVVVLNRRAPMEVFQNITSASGNWASLRLNQPAPNSDAIGAWIELDTAMGRYSREVTIGGGHVSGVLGAEHFGLGQTNTALARVIWPDGETSSWTEVPLNRHLRLSRDGGSLTVKDY